MRLLLFYHILTVVFQTPRSKQLDPIPQPFTSLQASKFGHDFWWSFIAIIQVCRQRVKLFPLFAPLPERCCEALYAVWLRSSPSFCRAFDLLPKKTAKRWVWELQQSRVWGDGVLSGAASVEPVTPLFHTATYMIVANFRTLIACIHARLECSGEHECDQTKKVVNWVVTP